MTTPPNPPSLNALLADGSRAGVRPLPPGSAVRIAAAASALGFSCAQIDLGQCEDKPALLALIASTMGFPDWFGHNWDALSDCLGDLGWQPAPGHVMLFEHAGAFRDQHSEDFETLLSILRETSTSWAAEKVPFWAFVDLSGPDVN